MKMEVEGGGRRGCGDDGGTKKLASTSPAFCLLRASDVLREEKRRAVYTAKTHRSRARATPGTFDSLFPGRGNPRDL